MDDLPTQPAVVVGIDGSRAAIRAALWAVDEAVSRDIPLRLVHVLESGSPQRAEESSLQLARAERFIEHAVRAVEATHHLVKIETEVMRGRPAEALIRLSRRAAMICVGAVGSNHFQHGRIGSTSAALAGYAHCAVAIFHHSSTARPPANVILAATDDSPDDGVLLETAAREAAIRGAPLRVITCWQPPRSDPAATIRGDLEITAQLERRLARWRARYPGVCAEATAVHGVLSGYLATHAAQLQLVIVSARGPGHVREVVGAAGYGALATSDCVVLVVDHQHL